MGEALFKIEKDLEALDSFERALDLVDDQELQERIKIYLLELLIGFLLGDFELIRRDWLILTKIGKHDPSWHEEASELLLAAVQEGYLNFVRSLITDSQTNDVFFPLAHAIDYHASGDEALIEKLSPEMRALWRRLCETAFGSREGKRNKLKCKSDKHRLARFLLGGNAQAKQKSHPNG